MRIGITTIPYTGHLNAMTALGRTLQDRGHEVIFFAKPDAGPAVQAAGLTFRPHCETRFPLGTTAEDVKKIGALTGEDATRYTVKLITESCQAMLEETPALLEELKLDGLLVDMASQGVEIVAMRMGVPFVQIFCTPFLDMTGETPLFFFPWMHEDSDAARARNAQGLAGFMGMKNLIDGLQVAYLQREGLTADTSDPYWSRSKLACITQMPKELDFSMSHLPSQYVYAGPFHDGKGRAVVEFPWERLTGEPLIYVSMGTIQNGREEIFRTLLAGTEREGYQVVLSAGSAIAIEALKPERESTIVVKSAPQLELLKKATLCVTHAGLNTTLEALAQGVPLLAIPVANDQPGVAARIVAAGVGRSMQLATLTADDLRKNVTEVLADEELRARVKKMQQAIQSRDGLAVAADTVERVFASA